jgi:hypothetical protein
LNTSASHPDANIDWSQFEPISGIPNYATNNKIPYTEEYMLSIERGFGKNTVLSASYVGTSRIICWCWRKPIPATPRCASISAIRPTWRPARRPAVHSTKATFSSPRRAR